jgi:2-ketocyclohexanecarboxyl-CoA hydrolase
MSDLLVDVRGPITWLRLNRPERRNAYDLALLDELTATVRRLDADSILIITGSGGSFCAGGYLANVAEADAGQLRRLYNGSLDLFDSLRAHPMPVLAAVNGAAVGGGNELVVACDLAIAAESAFFGQTGPRVGSAPVLGGTNMLAASVGEKRAKEIAFLCRRYPAREALELGWINAVVRDDRLEDEASAWANELLAMSPRYLEIAKVSSNAWWNTCRESYVSGLGMLMQAIGSADMVEGAQAFLEKRKPDFRGAARSGAGA